MVAIHRAYTREVYQQLRYRPTWLPGTPMELGSVGVLEDGIFRPVTDLGRLGIAFEVSNDPVTDGAMDFSSQGGVSVTFKAAGELNEAFRSVAAAEAGALVEFSREHATVLQLRGVSIDRISDQARLGRDLLHAVGVADEARRWQRDWVVVADLVRAGSGTVVIASSAASRMELKASGTVAPNSLADASADLQVASESQVATKVVAESGLTPLYRGLRIRRNFWWLYDEVLQADAEVPAADEAFGEADPSDDL